MDWNIILTNLINVGYGVLIFAIFYLSNMGFSLWYNIKLLSQKFDTKKLLNGGLKLLCFGTSLTLLCMGITILPEFANTVGWTIPSEYKEVLENIVIIGSFLLASCKYGVEAFSKMKAILFEKIPNNTNSDS